VTVVAFLNDIAVKVVTTMVAVAEGGREGEGGQIRIRESRGAGEKLKEGKRAR
jgi:hypothetical protein